MVASEGLGVWGALWIQVMGDLLLPLMADLARFVSTRARDFPGESPQPGMLRQCFIPSVPKRGCMTHHHSPAKFRTEICRASACRHTHLPKPPTPTTYPYPTPKHRLSLHLSPSMSVLME